MRAEGMQLTFPLHTRTLPRTIRTLAITQKYTRAQICLHRHPGATSDQDLRPFFMTGDVNAEILYKCLHLKLLAQLALSTSRTRL